MLAGLEDVDEGEILIDDKNVVNLPPRSRDIAMVFQNYALYPHMNVAENMGFALKIAKVKKAEIERACRRRRRSSTSRTTSSASRASSRRPASARRDGPRDRAPAARVPDGRAALEPRREAARRDAQQIAALQRRLGVTTVYVTHDQVEAMTMGDRVAVMKDGVLQQVDVPRCSTTRRSTRSSPASSARPR
jgi:multiple sugar transport system ATP-binding protein